MFELAHNYACADGMKHYVEMIQKPQYVSAARRYKSVTHQQKVNSGNFENMTTVIQGGRSTLSALTLQRNKNRSILFFGTKKCAF